MDPTSDTPASLLVTAVTKVCLTLVALVALYVTAHSFVARHAIFFSAPLGSNQAHFQSSLFLATEILIALIVTIYQVLKFTRHLVDNFA